MRRIILLAASLLLTGTAFSFTIDNQVSTGDPLASSSCTTPATKTSFRADDDSAYLWLHAVNITAGDTVEWRWSSPNNAPYTTASYQFPFGGTGCAWAGIIIKGQTAATLPGQWKVDVYVNNVFAATANFSIAPSAPLGGGAAHLEFAVNDQLLVPWGYVNLAYRLKSFQPGLHVDLYLGLLLGDGSPQCVSPDMVFASGLSPFANDLALSNSEAVITAGHLPPQVNPFSLTLYGVVVGHGLSPADSANWVSNLAAMDLAFGPLSSDQLDVLAERGNPQAYVIQFFRDQEQRIESWVYDGGGLGQVFQFVNGRRLASDNADTERAADSASSSATFFGPGRFVPTTTPAQIRALLGDPDRVLTKSPQLAVWFFTTNRITVTVENGAVSRVEAY